MKFCQCYTDVTKVAVHSQHAKLKNQMLQCYGFTAHPRAKKRKKYVNYHKLIMLYSEDVLVVTLMLQSLQRILDKSSLRIECYGVTALQLINVQKI